VQRSSISHGIRDPKNQGKQVFPEIVLNVENVAHCSSTITINYFVSLYVQLFGVEEAARREENRVSYWFDRGVFYRGRGRCGGSDGKGTPVGVEELPSGLLEAFSGRVSKGVGKTGPGPGSELGLGSEMGLGVFRHRHHRAES